MDKAHCNVCCGITTEVLVLLGEIECLHFFCSPGEGEAFKAVDIKIVKTLMPFLRKTFININYLQSVMKETIRLLGANTK